MATTVPPSLALAVAKVESDFRARALSSAGARGVMQIMPATAKGEFGVSADELWDARLNVQLGIDFLARLIKRYDGRWDLALSHYNGGRVMGSGRRATPLPATRKEVAAVGDENRATVDGHLVAAMEVVGDAEEKTEALAVVVEELRA